MYENIGSKIKGLATTIFVIEAIASVILGIVLLATDEALILLGIITLIGGPIVAWVSSFLLYGFGELIDKTSKIEENTRRDGNDSILSENVKTVSFSTINNESEEENNTTPITKPYSKPVYNCISINSTGKKSHGLCVVCKSSNVNLEKSKIQTEIGTRTLDICKNCYKEFYNASTRK